MESFFNTVIQYYPTIFSSFFLLFFLIRKRRSVSNEVEYPIPSADQLPEEIATFLEKDFEDLGFTLAPPHTWQGLASLVYEGSQEPEFLSIILADLYTNPSSPFITKSLEVLLLWGNSKVKT